MHFSTIGPHRSQWLTTMVSRNPSGDTGSAVASGFHGVEGINVYLLYPSGKVSSIQEKQLRYQYARSAGAGPGHVEA